MLNTKKKANSTSQNSKQLPSSSAINTLVTGTRVEGHLTAQSDIRIDGVLKGSLDCSGKIIIGPEGRIEGDIVCTNAVVEGRFEGSLEVKDTLQVREKAVINGDITTDKLIVHSGAIFNVTCRMGGQVLGDYNMQKDSVLKKAELKVS